MNTYDGEPAAHRANNFDLLRLVFALLVVVTHTRELSDFHSDNPLFYLSVWGIDGFFIISGYLIYESLSRHSGLAGYGLRRLFRIYPAYVAVILIQCVLMVALQPGAAPLGEIFKYLISNLIFLNFLQPVVGDIFAGLKFNAVNGALWTLKIEVTFYILLPFAMLLLRRYFLPFVVFAVVLSIIINAVLFDAGLHRLSNQFPAKFYLFGAGILLAAYGSRIPWPVYGLAVVFAGIFLFSMALPRYLWLLLEMVCLGAAIQLIAFVTPPVRLRWDVSYTVYLLHFPVIQFSVFLAVPEAMTFESFLAYVLVCTFAGAYVLTALIERPLLAYGRRMAKKFPS